MIPPSLHQLVISELHSGHIRIVKMKALARSYFWWPGLDKDIESSIKSCSGCERNKRDPKLAPPHPWECATKPCERIHVEFAGPLEGKMYLIAVDCILEVARSCENGYHRHF